jgi:hypothetical protein
MGFILGVDPINSPQGNKILVAGDDVLLLLGKKGLDKFNERIWNYYA